MISMRMTAILTGVPAKRDPEYATSSGEYRRAGHADSPVAMSNVPFGAKPNRESPGTVRGMRRWSFGGRRWPSPRYPGTKKMVARTLLRTKIRICLAAEIRPRRCPAMASQGFHGAWTQAHPDGGQ